MPDEISDLAELHRLRCRQDPRWAADEITRLRAAVMSVQRSAFDAGFDAGQDGGIKAWAYEAWASQQEVP